nr:unnamed protein product [Spirometra erinaceieuropaei]
MEGKETEHIPEMQVTFIAVGKEGGRCYGENAATEASKDLRLGESAFEIKGHSYSAVVTMKQPERTAAMVRALALREGGTQKSCTMRPQNDVLSCVISRLQPNSIYTVALETCMQNAACTAYKNSIQVRTTPSAPRYISVTHRTSSTFEVFWVKSLEDVNGQYVYKVKAVGGNTIHTCESSSSSSCIVTNLARGTKYEVSVSACTVDDHCSDYTTPVLGETLPNPPHSPQLVQKTEWALTTLFKPPADDENGNKFVYAGTFESTSDVNFYGGGCETKKLTDTSFCKTQFLAPATQYKFRTFACTHETFLCAEGESKILETAVPREKYLHTAQLEDGRILAKFYSNMKNEDNGDRYFRLRVDGLPDGVVKMPVREGYFTHTFSGVQPFTTYFFYLDVCNGADCSNVHWDIASGFFGGVKANPPTEITQTTAFVSWSDIYGTFVNLPYGFAYAIPEDKSLGQQQCVGVDRNSCTLQHLRPDTVYNIVIKGCENLGRCYRLTNPIKIRTAKADSLETVSDVRVSNVTAKSFSLTWTQPPADKDDSFEYKIALKSPGDQRTAERSFFCETTSVEGTITFETYHRQNCQLRFDEDLLIAIS